MGLDVFVCAAQRKRRIYHAVSDPDARTVSEVLDLYLTSGTATAIRDRLQKVENPAIAGLSQVGRTGLEPVTSCLSSRRSPS